MEGRTGQVLTMTYRPGGGQLWRKSERFHNAHGRLWKIVADWSVSDARDTAGDALFDAAVDALRTR